MVFDSEFFVSTIISGIIWDVIKSGFDITKSIFDKFNIGDETVIENVVNDINNKRTEIKSREDVSLILKEEEYIKFIKTLRYKTPFSERLDYAFAKINETVKPKFHLNVEVLGRLMNLGNCDKLLLYAYGDENPSYDCESEIAKVLGISENWMQTGNGIFSDVIRGSEVYDVKCKISELHPKNIWLIYDKFHKDIFLIMEFNEYSYRLTELRIPFRKEIGGWGSKTVYEFYKLIHELRNDNQIQLSNCLSVIDYDLYDEVLHGAHPAQALMNPIQKYGSFVEDLLWLNCNDDWKKKFEIKYGSDFIYLQKMISLMKGENNE